MARPFLVRCAGAVLALACGLPAGAATTMPLGGDWRFALDRDDAGVAAHWEGRTLPDRIRVPGILNAQGYGDEITAQTPWVLSLYDKHWNLRDEYKAFTTPGHVKVPFLSQPPRHYLGPAWYQRDVDVPRDWAGRRVVLHLERPRWGSSAWIDGRVLGSNLSLVAPHDYDLGVLAPGRHKVTVRVDSRVLMAYRPDSHSISDSLGMSWNGIVGAVELRATSPVYIDDAQVFPDVADRSVVVKVSIGNGGGNAGQGTIAANGRRFPVRWGARGGSAEIRVAYPKDAKTWDEWHPVLQSLKLRLAGPGADDARDVSFGFVQVAARGTDILVNGRPVFLRGTHHGGDFPLTGYPPTDVAYWKKIFAINKAWGINHVRFHSFTPPEAAFQAADEVGIYLQPEPGMWNRFEPGSPIAAMLNDETERLIRAYGNHPSFLLLSPSNEPSGRWKEVFAQWRARFRAEDPRRLYTNGTGHTEPVVPDLDQDTDYLAVQRIGPKPLRNKTGWFGRDYAASLEGIHVPVIAHEMGQWVAYPDFGVIDKFKGYLQPGNYEIFRESARRHGVLDRDHDFALASGRWQLACYKEEIEAALRTRGMSGYQLLDLHDYLGQGTALVGLLDTFWETKGYATPDVFRRFNGETVPLARLTRTVLTTRDTFDVPVEIAHYGEKPLAGARPWWRIEDDVGRAVADGRFAAIDIPIGKNIPLGRVTADLAGLPAPSHYKLVVGLDGTAVVNDWNFWVYPAAVDESVPDGVLVTHAWAEAERRLADGGKVLYLPRKADLDWTSPPLADVPVFWNRLMNPAWSRMLGLWVDRAHPALAGFPTADHMDWQWSELVVGARAFNLERLPAGLKPIVQPIDDWNRNYRLGAVFEANVGRGRLVVSTFDLESRLDERPVARQLRRSLLDYMAGARFRPVTDVDPAALRASLFDTRVMKKLGAVASGWPGAANVVDGDPNTYALVAVKGDAPRPQPPLTITLAHAVPYDGLVLMPRQNHRDHEGDVHEWRIEASDDGEHWRDVARPVLGSTFDPQTVRFGSTVTARSLRLTPLSGFGDDRASALADVAVIYVGPALPDEAGELEYKRSRSTSADIDEAGMDDRPRRRRKPMQ
ncbi:discoidin domain-containing protein [Massilia pinisoli]|uniref:beta-galactosidase n=1 Tax=Massilia pinisoli TaxID=1772194 RepID=A0ABT1ZT96_9BURK|nr:discoidin domain-containing protein [Massilia pinisoli]MCS0583133.1 discoidin domain-containing protein [Massilia pinisoli]